MLDDGPKKVRQCALFPLAILTDRTFIGAKAAKQNNKKIEQLYKLYRCKEKITWITPSLSSHSDIFKCFFQPIKHVEVASSNH